MFRNLQSNDLHKYIAFMTQLTSYSHATTKLAVSSNEISQISSQKHKIGSLLLSSRYKTNYIKSFPHAHFSGTMKVVENLSRKAYGETINYWKDIYYIGIVSMRQIQCVPTMYVTENKETSFKFTFKPSTMFIVFAYFKHLKTANQYRIPVTTPQIVYIFMTAISPNLIS